MKKTLFWLVVSCVLLFAACGTTQDTGKNVDDGVVTDKTTADKSTSSQTKADTDKTVIDTLIPVTVVMPADYVNEKTSDEIADSYKEYGDIKVSVNPDGSAALVMTKAQQKAILEDFRNDAEESFASIVNDDAYPNIVSIKASDDYKKYTVVTKSRDLEFGETLVEIIFRILGEYYSVFSGGTGDVSGLIVEYVDQTTGKVFKSTDPAFVPDNTPTPTPSPTNTPSPTPLLQVEKIDEKTEVYMDYDNKRICAYWAKYKNTGEGIVRIDDAGIDFYDNDGQWIGSDDHAWCIPAVVKPGEEFYIINDLYELGSAYTNNGCVPKALFELKAAENYFSVDVLGVSFNKGEWYGLEITAKVKNNNQKDYKYVYPYAVMFDASGRLVGYGMGSSKTFYAEKEDTVKLDGYMFGTERDYGKVKKVEVHIVGDKK